MLCNFRIHSRRFSHTHHNGKFKYSNFVASELRSTQKSTNKRSFFVILRWCMHYAAVIRLNYIHHYSKLIFEILCSFMVSYGCCSSLDWFFRRICLSTASKLGNLLLSHYFNCFWVISWFLLLRDMSNFRIPPQKSSSRMPSRKTSSRVLSQKSRFRVPSHKLIFLWVINTAAKRKNTQFLQYHPK